MRCRHQRRMTRPSRRFPWMRSASEDSPAWDMRVKNTMVTHPAKTGGTKEYINAVISLVKAKNPSEIEFHQAVLEVVESLAPVLDRHPEYRSARILERIVEPERVVMFRVPWLDDRNEVQVNRG